MAKCKECGFNEVECEEAFFCSDTCGRVWAEEFLTAKEEDTEE